MLVPKNGDYRWVHDQHEKWDTKAKENLQHLDQIIDGHLGWYNAHKTTSDIIRTRRAMPDLSLAHKKSKKRKLSDIQEPAQVTEDIFTEEDYPTDKSGQEENNVVETEKEEEECDNNQTQEDNNSRESDKDHVVNNTEDTLNGNVDNGHLDSTLQEERMTLSTDDHNNPEYSNTPLTHNRIEVVSSIRIRPTILESLDKPPEPPEPPKSSFISRLLNLHKNKASKTTTETTEASKTIETTETETAASTQVNDACTTETIQHVVEADNKSMDNQTLDDAECSDTRNEKDDIVVSEVVPEPRLRFQSKKKKTQEATQAMEHVSKVDTSISSTTTNGSNKVIREIDDDEEMEQLSEEEPNHKPENNRPLVPSWAQGHALERQLEKQHRLDPTHIFGPIKPIKLKDIFQTRSSSKKGNA